MSGALSVSVRFGMRSGSAGFEECCGQTHFRAGTHSTLRVAEGDLPPLLMAAEALG